MSLKIYTAIFAIATLIGLSTAANADEVAKNLAGFKSLKVTLGENAGDCNLAGAAKMFGDRLAGHLTASGLQLRGDAFSDVELVISNQKFGVLGGHCALDVSVTFRGNLPAQNITGVSDRARRVIDGMGHLPIMLWHRSAFAVTPLTEPSAGGPSLEGQKFAVILIDRIAEQFDQARN